MSVFNVVVLQIETEGPEITKKPPKIESFIISSVLFLFELMKNLYKEVCKPT